MPTPDEQTPATPPDAVDDPGSAEVAVPEPAYVVGVGASAGGLEALEHLFGGMPTDTGMAFVVVQHLSPDFKSQMAELLGRWTHLHIRTAAHDEPIAPNTIYLMPPNHEMIISGGRLLLKERSQELTLPIDLFLRSLAQDVGSRAVAIVLSGTGSDGSRGVRAVQAAGGLVVVQSENSAKFDGMPKSAIQTGAVDLILPPEEIPAALLRHLAGTGVLPTHGDDSEAVKEGGMQAVLELLREGYGIDFTCYKPSTITRRTERRLQLNRSADLSEYIERLRSDRTELDALYQDLLIGVTEFFRDKAAFRSLENNVLPELVSWPPRGGQLRAWVAGCATGEEAYSLAILLSEQCSRRNAPLDIKIFATDVYRPSLKVASVGIYPPDCLTGVSQERMERFFTPVEGGYKVSNALRQMIVFAPHNLIRDAPFTKLDVISCRNLLIYLQPSSQKKVLSLFHFGLRTDGVLFLGPSESPGDVSEEFDVVDQHWRIYRKRRDVHLLPGLRTPLAGALPSLLSSRGEKSRPPDELNLLPVFGSLLDGILPPSVLVTSNHQIVHSFGDIASFLRLPRGRPSLSLLDMLDGELKLAVAGALHRAARVHTPVSFSGIRVEPGPRALNLSVTPVSPERMGQTTFLVSLADAAVEVPSPSAPIEPMDLHEASHQRLEALEQELLHTKENLQATIEELESSNEELQSTNEELLAANEELQSTNEELHSVNEELYTVNTEYQKKIDELTELSDDMSNLLLSTEVHTLFLDDNLCIRKVTPSMAEVFNLLPSDIGRRIDSFAHTIELDGLTDRLNATLDHHVRHEIEVSTKKGDPYLMRIVPYRGAIAGVVLTLIDLSSIKRWEKALREQVDQRDRFLAILSHELRNPLSAVMNAIGLIRRRLPSEPSIEPSLAMVTRQSQHMARLLDDLLDLSRITHGKITLQRKVIDLRRLVQDAVEALRAASESHQHQLEVRVPDQPVWVDADTARMLQMVENLIGNAIKYTPDQGRIAVELTTEDGVALLQVEDNGRGIDAAELDHIFDMFIQGDHTLERSHGGLGVGLTLVRNLVEMHGGSIQAHSDGPGHGSTFFLRVPVAPAPITRDAPTSADHHRPLRLVLVEDQDDIRMPLAELLREDGYHVEDAANGRDGLELIRRTLPDVALLDIGLPDLDGYEVARQVRTEYGPDAIHLIALTGYGREDDRRAVIEAGFDEHLIKPVMPEDIVAALQRLANGDGG